MIRNVTVKDTSFVLDDIDVSHIKKKAAVFFTEWLMNAL